jgi:hypothetical protein
MSTFVRLLASGVLLLSAAAPAAGAAPALSGAPAAATPAGTAGYCPGETGVTVVVDFTDLGGDVVVRCRPGETGTGLDALTGAGFTFEGTQRWGTAFICRLQGRPTADEELPVKGSPDYQEQCIDTPPTAASWSYSPAGTAASGPTAPSSAKTHRAIEGGFEGWRFTLNGRAPSRRWRAATRSDTSEPRSRKSRRAEPPRRPRDRPSNPRRRSRTDRSRHQPTSRRGPKPTDSPGRPDRRAAAASAAASVSPDKPAADKPRKPEGQARPRPRRGKATARRAGSAPRPRARP